MMSKGKQTDRLCTVCSTDIKGKMRENYFMMIEVRTVTVSAGGVCIYREGSLRRCWENSVFLSEWVTQMCIYVKTIELYAKDLGTVAP